MKVALMIAAVLLPFVSAASLGGSKVVDLDLFDNKVGFASSAINEYLLAQNSEAKPHHVLKVIKATRQVVAGLSYHLTLQMEGDNGNKICHVTVVEKAWETPSLTSSGVSCEAEKVLGGDDHDYQKHGQSGPLLGGDDHDYQPHGRSECDYNTNSMGMPGGAMPIAAGVKNESVVFAASAINSHYLASNENAKPRTAVEVICATSQIVAGIQYKYKIQLTSENGIENCDVTVLFRPWETPNYSASNIMCKPETVTVQALQDDTLLGGEQEADFNDEMVQQALAMVADRANAMSNSMYRVIPSGGRVTKQVVQGVIYHFYGLSLMETTCQNNEDSMGKVAAEECPINSNSVTDHGSVNAKVYWDLKSFKIQDFDLIR